MKKITLLALFLSLNSFATIIVRDTPDYTFSSTNNNFPFDFNSDGTNEFTFEYTNSVSCYFYSNNDLNFVTVGTTQWDILKSLPLNTLISSASYFGCQGDAYINPGWATSTSIFPAGDSYIGTKFKIGTSIYYGWILVNSTGGESGTITIKSYAYNNVAGQSINAGQTTLGIDSFSSTKYNVFPNPISDNFRIESNSSSISEFKVSVIDINGKSINLTSSDYLFNSSPLNPGIYFLKIEDSLGNSEIKKVIKN